MTCRLWEQYLGINIPVRWSRVERPSFNINSTTRIAQYVVEPVDGMSLDCLRPPPSKQKEAHDEMVFKLSEQDYASKPFAATGTNTTTLGDSEVAGTHEGHSGIEANEWQGVFALSSTRRTVTSHCRSNDDGVERSVRTRAISRSLQFLFFYFKSIRHE